jgi:hypothetical protein
MTPLSREDTAAAAGSDRTPECPEEGAESFVFSFGNFEPTLSKQRRGAAFQVVYN